MKSSTQVRHLILRPVASASMKKSIDHVKLGAAGRSNGRRSVACPLDGFYLAYEMITAVHALLINSLTFPSQ